MSELEVQRMLCWIGEEGEEEGGMEEERWKYELMRVREEFSIDIIPSRVSLNVGGLTHICIAFSQQNKGCIPVTYITF